MFNSRGSSYQVAKSRGAGYMWVCGTRMGIREYISPIKKTSKLRRREDDQRCTRISKIVKN